MADRITQSLPTTVSLPAMGQGAIGIECRIDDLEVNQMLQVLHHEATNICVSAERAMNARLNGGCQVPIGGFAQIEGEQLFMRGLVGHPDGSLIYRAERSGTIAQANEIGVAIAEDLLAQGADKILQALYS
jgi:hydroxymethylbilane synthase